MCFSAEASFAASAVITGIGVLGVSKAQTNSLKVFAAIPILFGVQQFVEGLLWISLSNQYYAGWTYFATRVFLFFAWVIWPVYVPLSARLLETNSARKVWLNLFLLMGITVSLFLGYTILFENIEASIAGYHIHYTLDYEFRFPSMLGVLYFIPIAFSLFISGVKRIWLIGALIVITFILTALFYREHLISVWCFFAAIISISVFWMVHRLNHKKRMQAE